ncbi:hypothetical protein QM467_06055 [Rhodoblastus sp. 17X3]|uniref:hypothetical protein n=1 Tax=Rhodoblastus sp. 17X3 TaxID=3047026 RepID=UPI0024B71DC5|nr:hypothetical protein [Rhodoblastus sp. 17X3]MDI9847624.1 hypothetical protein [Rhodoblastus sp. 17X3]
MRRLAFVLGAAFSLIGGASFAAPASEDRFCSGASFSDTPALNVGRIKADAGKVNFRKNGDAANACPSTGADCQEKAYLVPGDLVVLGVTKGDFVCVDYETAKGSRGGWLPASAIEPAPAATDPTSWAGKWKRIEANISIETAGGGLKAEGSASFGSLDPDRVKRGAVNSGEFSGPLLVKGGQAVFTDKDADPKEPDASCRLRMARAGEVLFVQDNMQCGGLNVSFSGLYRRAGK